ncbi:hypothetical protein F7018_17045 [Tenacibaculum aiptasiae]|uniref:Uncharacterized protein n=1 Tax=Tenacibaculum aiptasiae TaxID=426481 RepID=A0A7J5A7D4_9FLAO|nr:hypothetical protein [Tenacibaculum aiptasiae]KAB1153373.1 hypothetical protein F7018_17045 [Tenacibaculum aiptasiae]
MKIVDLYRFESKSFTSNLELTTIEEKLIHEFNLNTKRSLKTFFQKEYSTYEGTIKEHQFKIKLNDHNHPDNVLYFFFTQVTGEIVDKGTERVILLNAELSETIITLIVGSSPIYLLILIFSNLWTGISCFLFLGFMYVLGRINVKSDFYVFEQELKRIVPLYNI